MGKKSTSNIVQNDCEKLLKTDFKDKIHLTFLDPPFNQDKDYQSHDDNMPEIEYWNWMKRVCELIYEKTADGGAIYFMQREKNASFVFLSTILLLPFASLPLIFGIVNGYFGAAIILASLGFLFLAYKVYQDCSQEAAKQLMFGSITFLPLVQIILVLGHI